MICATRYDSGWFFDEECYGEPPVLWRSGDKLGLSGDKVAMNGDKPLLSGDNAFCAQFQSLNKRFPT